MMDFSPLWQEDFPIPAHALMAMAAIALGGIQLAAPKGALPHRWLGWTWVLLMSGVAITGLFIFEIRWWGPFSPIHLLIPLLFYSLWQALRAIRNGDTARHRREMISLYVYALIITGLFTLWPGRAMHQLLFGG